MMDNIETQMTSDGFVAALAGNIAFALVPMRDGKFRVANCMVRGELSAMNRSDFYSVGGEISDIEDFKAYVADYREHQRQAAELGRTEQPSNTRTPWGESQGATVYVGDGIYFHSTARHGGFKVYEKYNRQIPEPYRNADGWYEEDCEYAKVIVSLPGFFTEREVREAQNTVRGWFPDEYETVTGETIPEGQSFKKDEGLFKERNADNWVVISVSSIDGDGPNMVRCQATKGGLRSGWYGGKTVEVDTAEFVVPAEEYSRRGPHGFVIDTDRHERVNGSDAILRM